MTQYRRDQPAMPSYSTVYALRRFGLKLFLCLLFALAQTGSPWGFGKSFALLLLLFGAVDIVMALVTRERPWTKALSYWDEAASFIALAILARRLL